MGNYRLSEKADQDIQSIFEFGVERFGIVQAETYLLGLHDEMAVVAARPQTWPHVEIRNMPFQRCVYKSHSIYYRQTRSDVLIVRVLGQQDIDQAFLD